METPPKVLRKKHFENVISQLTSPVKVPPTPLLKHLGCGTGVNVYQLDRSPQNGKLMSPWALKRVSKRAIQNRAKVYEGRLKDEAEILRKLQHPNIVGFRGVLKSTDGKENLALEYCNTSLSDLIEAKTEGDDMNPFPANKILRMCVDVSKALAYLHNEAKILHGDIKSPNILVKGDFEICKLCDFGVSLPLNDEGEIDRENHPNLQFVGTDIWSAPEALDDGIITDRCDIFSFGLVIYEMIALMPPHTWHLGFGTEDDGNSEESDEEVEFLGPVLGTRPPLPEAFSLSDEYRKAVEVFYLCTNEIPEDRPSAKNLIMALMK